MICAMCAPFGATNPLARYIQRRKTPFTLTARNTQPTTVRIVVGDMYVLGRFTASQLVQLHYLSH